MKKLFLIAFMVLVCVGIKAADIKVGDAKYEVTSANAVVLKEFKKATGDVVIPSSIKDPKSGAEYKVEGIAKEAFKKAPLTSVEIPASITNIGSSAFAECPALKKVKWGASLNTVPMRCFDRCKELSEFNGFEKIECIENAAFEGTGFTEIILEPSLQEINFHSFGDCKNLISVEIPYSNYPLTMADGSFLGTPVEYIYVDRAIRFKEIAAHLAKYRIYSENNALKGLFIGDNANIMEWPEKFLDGCPNASVIFMNPEAGKPAVYAILSSHGATDRLLESSQGRSYPVSDRFYMQKVRSAFLGQEIEVNHYVDAITKYPYHNYYFGAHIENGKIELDGQPLNTKQAAMKAMDNAGRDIFIEKLNRFVEVAVEDPKSLNNEYRNIEPSEAMKYHDLLFGSISVLVDSVYLVKPEMTEDEINNLGGFINNMFMEIGYDYGLANMNLEKWAKNDILGKDITSNAHKDYYELVLKTADRYYRVADKNKNPYHTAMQLACLCGLGRWKEAAAYFPKVHRFVTENGQWAVPSELTYMQQMINKNGYKAVAPSYAKAKTSKSGVSKSSNGLVELFTEAAIGAAVDSYKEYRQRKAYKKWLKQIDKKFYKSAKKGVYLKK